MKKLTTLLLCSVFLFGCEDGLAKDREHTNKYFILKSELKGDYYLNLRVYQHVVSGNCYAQYGDFRGGFSQVPCSDFGIKDPEQLKEESLRKERIQYEKLKRKFEGEG